MKKFILPIAAIATVAFMTSCVKQRNCKCTYSDGSIENITVLGTKSGAKAACTGYEDNSTTCELTK